MQIKIYYVQRSPRAACVLCEDGHTTRNNQPNYHNPNKISNMCLHRHVETTLIFTLKSTNQWLIKAILGSKRTQSEIIYYLTLNYNYKTATMIKSKNLGKKAEM